MRTETGYFIESQARTAGDDQEVVGQLLVIFQQQIMTFWLDAFDGLADEADTMARHQLVEVEPDGFRGSPFDCNPGVGRREFEVRLV